MKTLNKKAFIFFVIFTIINSYNIYGCKTYETLPLSNSKDKNQKFSILKKDDFQKAIDDIGLFISECIKDRGNQTIAVTGIRSIDGYSNGLAVFLSECITASLSKYENLHVLERSRLDEIISEFKISYSDFFDPDRTKEVGKFISTDLIVCASIAKIENNFNLSLRVVDCESGQINSGCALNKQIPGNKSLVELWGKKTSLTVSVYPLNAIAEIYVDNNLIGYSSSEKNVLFVKNIKSGKHKIRVKARGYETFKKTININQANSHSMNIRLFKPLKLSFWQEDAETGDIIGNNGKIYSNKSYRFCFRANQDCYVYVFNKGTTGKLFPLFPNDQILVLKSNYIPANIIKKIPERGAFPLTGPPGEETIFAIASINPYENLRQVALMIKEKQGKAATSIFNKEIKKISKKVISKDYGNPTQPYVSESFSLNETDNIFMKLIYQHISD